MIEVIDEVLIPGDSGYTHRLLNIRYNGLEGKVVYLRHDNDFRCDVYLDKFYSHFGNLVKFEELQTNFEYCVFEGFITGLAELLGFNKIQFETIRKEIESEHSFQFKGFINPIRRDI